MNEDFLKVELSPSEGQMYGTFTEGMPLAEAVGMLVVLHVDDSDGARRRYYGVVAAVADELKHIDNTDSSNDQVIRTHIWLADGPMVSLIWDQIAVAVAEVASHAEGAGHGQARE